MESINRLRQAADELAQRAMPCSNAPDYADVRWKVHQLADEIEREVKERYVLLPIDADGVPIHVGDVLDPPAGCDDYTPLLVMRLTYDGYEDEWFFDGDVGGFCGMVAQYMDVAGWTHHHAPTVEDVLREFASVGIHIAAKHGIKAGEFDFYADEEAVAEYAGRLRLAGDE